MRVESTFTVEATDSTAFVTITRLWMSGMGPAEIAKAMQLGLLPPKAK